MCTDDKSDHGCPLSVSIWSVLYPVMISWLVTKSSSIAAFMLIDSQHLMWLFHQGLCGTRSCAASLMTNDGLLSACLLCGVRSISQRVYEHMIDWLMILFVPILILMIQSCHNFACATMLNSELCKVMTWSEYYFWSESIMNFDKIRIMWP